MHVGGANFMLGYAKAGKHAADSACGYKIFSIFSPRRDFTKRSLFPQCTDGEDLVVAHFASDLIYLSRSYSVTNLPL